MSRVSRKREARIEEQMRHERPHTPGNVGPSSWRDRNWSQNYQDRRMRERMRSWPKKRSP